MRQTSLIEALLGAVRFIYQASYAVQHGVYFQGSECPKNIMREGTKPAQFLQSRDLKSAQLPLLQLDAQTLVAVQGILCSEPALEIPRTYGPATEQDGRVRPI